jgi:hypothetical protein
VKRLNARYKKQGKASEECSSIFIQKIDWFDISEGSKGLINCPN